MKRIFLTLAILATIVQGLTIFWGISIGDATSRDPAVQSQVSQHMLIGLGSLTFSTLVHAICLTYFMGTGRWIEETSGAYSLSEELHAKSQRNKYRTLPGMTLCLLLMLSTGALGAIADPGSPTNTVFGMPGNVVHFWGAILTSLTNILVHLNQFAAIARNSKIVDSILTDVQRIREERGLPT